MERFTFATVSLLLVALSCSKIERGTVVPPLETGSVEEVLIASTSDNSVSLNDILEVISRDHPATKNADYPYELSSYVGDDSDTLMYILNLGEGDGWKIYSSDKRTPAILAEGDEGYFSLDEGSPAVAAWMSCVASDMARIKNASDDELTFNNDEIISNKSFWLGSQGQSRLLDPNLPITPYPSGHWEETILSSSVVEDTVVNHMLPKWDQNAPYNECCPYCIDPPTQRAHAGCVAVAGAQVLYYLHYKLGVPSEMYSSGLCMGDVYNYSRGFSDLSETVWDDMSMLNQNSSDIMIPEAILIGYVGNRVNMHYNDLLIGNPFSWAVPVNLKSNLFEYHGISCSHDAYDEDVVANSLLNNMPVIISATNLLAPLDFNIHCFVIDGYRSTRTEYTHLHYYVWDVRPTEPYLPFEEYTTTSYSSPIVSQIKINWGWRSQWTQSVNDGWYTLTGRWVLDDGSDYNYYRKMIYDFALTE